MRKLATLACLAGACVMSAATAQQAGPPPVSLPQASQAPRVPAPSPAFDPAKPNEVGPVWTYHDEKRPFIIMALSAGHAVTGPMRFWIESEGRTGPSRVVKIDPASDCVTLGAAPNETCSVNLTVTAVADGQFMAHVRFPQGIRNGPPGVTLRTILEIHGYGTGFGTKVAGRGCRKRLPVSRLRNACRGCFEQLRAWKRIYPTRSGRTRLYLEHGRMREDPVHSRTHGQRRRLRLRAASREAIQGPFSWRTLDTRLPKGTKVPL
jgi:hypothetical protein